MSRTRSDRKQRQSQQISDNTLRGVFVLVRVRESKFLKASDQRLQGIMSDTNTRKWLRSRRIQHVLQQPATTFVGRNCDSNSSTLSKKNRIIYTRTAFHTLCFSHFRVPYFPPSQLLAALSGLTFSTPCSRAVLCRIFMCCIFMSRIVSVPNFGPQKAKNRTCTHPA